MLACLSMWVTMILFNKYIQYSWCFCKMNGLHLTLQRARRTENYLINSIIVTLVQTVGLTPRTSTSNRSIFSLLYLHAMWIAWSPLYSCSSRAEIQLTHVQGQLYSNDYISCGIKFYVEVIYKHLYNIFMIILNCNMNWLQPNLQCGNINKVKGTVRTKCTMLILTERFSRLYTNYNLRKHQEMFWPETQSK